MDAAETSLSSLEVLHVHCTTFVWIREVCSLHGGRFNILTFITGKEKQIVNIQQFYLAPMHKIKSPKSIYSTDLKGIDWVWFL